MEIPKVTLDKTPQIANKAVEKKGRFSVIKGDKTKRLSFEGLISDQFKIAYKEKVNLLNRRNYIKMNVQEEGKSESTPVYVNINSLASRLMMSKKELLSLAKEPGKLEEVIKNRAENLKINESYDLLIHNAVIKSNDLTKINENIDAFFESKEKDPAVLKLLLQKKSDVTGMNAFDLVVASRNKKLLSFYLEEGVKGTIPAFLQPKKPLFKDALKILIHEKKNEMDHAQPLSVEEWGETLLWSLNRALTDPRNSKQDLKELKKIVHQLATKEEGGTIFNPKLIKILNELPSNYTVAPQKS